MLQEEDIGEGEMPDKPEYYLESLLSGAFNGKGFQKINVMIQEKDKYVPQKCKKQLLNQLDKALKKELDKNEFFNVSLLLKCIQLYCRSDSPESINLLLQQGLIPKTRELLSLIEKEDLVNLVENFFTTTLIISKSSTEGRKQLLDLFIEHLGHFAMESNVKCTLRQEALRTLNTLLANVTREEKKVFADSEEMCLLMKEFGKTVQDIGDYDIQVALVEALFRMMLKKCRDEMMHSWFEDQYVSKVFREIKDEDFETDGRKFLNDLNESLGDKRRIYSIPCKAAYAELTELSNKNVENSSQEHLMRIIPPHRPESILMEIGELKKPAEDKLEEFWIDFNYGSESITFYSQCLEDILWDSVRLPKENINNCYLQDQEGEKILIINMRKSVMINKAEITKLRIHFDSGFDVLEPLLKAIGKDKMIMLDEEENANQGQTTTAASMNFSLSNTPVSVQPERKEDHTEIDSLSDILTSSKSNELVTPVIIKEIIIPEETVVDGEKESQQLENKDGFQASSGRTLVSPSCSVNIWAAPPFAQKLKYFWPQSKAKAGEPNVEGEADLPLRETHPLKDGILEKKKRARGSSKKMVEAKMDEYEFCFSDANTHEMVSKMKQKIFVHKNTLHKSLEKGTMKRNMFERSLPSNYKTHLFSESNSDSLSNDQSEKSWIRNSQSNTLPKVADYTRKKIKVKSKLKVLPLSSPSSGSDYGAKKVENSTVPRDKIQRRKNPVSEIHHYTTHSPVYVCSTPNSQIRQNGLKVIDATLPLTNGSSFYPSDAETSKKHEAAASILLLEDNISNSKRKCSEWSADFNRKRSKHTEGLPSKEFNLTFEPRKLFSSIEMADETLKGQPLNEFENEVFVSKVLEEELGDSEVINAFEIFTSELKKKFWFRYKRMEIYTHTVMKAPEQNISALLHRIHKRRLHELEIFHQSVVKELAILEKRTEFLSSLEKDTVEFWTKQSNKLNSKLNAFCIRQIQRMESMDILPEATSGPDGTIHNENDGNATDHTGARSKTPGGSAN